MPEKTQLKSAVSKDGIHYNDVGDLVIPVRGIPFSVDGEKTDVVGDWFDKDTDLGPLQEFPSRFDHGDDDYLGNLRFGNQMIGKAVRTYNDDSGAFANIIIDRRTKFLDKIEWLTKNGYLDASSVADYRVNDPDRKGRVAKWAWDGLDLTPTNADARAEVQKSFSINMENNMPIEEELKAAEAKKKADEEAAAKAKADADAKAKLEAASGKTVEQLIQEGFEKLNKQTETPDKTPEHPENIQMAELVAEMKSGMKAISDRLEEVMKEKKSADNEKLETYMQELKGQMIDLITAIPELGKSIGGYIMGRTGEELTKSAAQREAEKQLAEQIAAANKKSGAGKDGVEPAYGKFKNVPGMDRRI